MSNFKHRDEQYKTVLTNKLLRADNSSLIQVHGEDLDSSLANKICLHQVEGLFVVTLIRHVNRSIQQYMLKYLSGLSLSRGLMF